MFVSGLSLSFNERITMIICYKSLKKIVVGLIFFLLLLLMGCEPKSVETMPTVTTIESFPFTFDFQGRKLTITDEPTISRIEDQDRFFANFEMLCDGGNISHTDIEEEVLSSDHYGNPIFMTIIVEANRMAEKTVLSHIGLVTASWVYPSSEVQFVSSPYLLTNKARPDDYWDIANATLIIQIKNDPADKQYNRFYIYHVDTIQYQAYP